MEPLDRAQAESAVTDGARRYFAERRHRVDPFIDRHFTVRGALRLHRAALGWDIARAPLNLAMSGPQAAIRGAGLIARLLGARRLARQLDRPLILTTDVAREIAWLIEVELLELPYQQRGRASTRNALTEAILAAPALEATLRAAAAESPAFQARLQRAIAEYAVSRAAAAEITTGMLSLGAGAVALNKLTPGAASLGPALAAIWAQQAAVGAFPLGAWLGSAWYGLFPVVPSPALIAGTTTGLVLAATTFSAFAGIVADPLQRSLGLHRRRLTRMIDALERQFFDPAAAGFAVRDHYVARLMDVFDWIGAAIRLTRL